MRHIDGLPHSKQRLKKGRAKTGRRGWACQVGPRLTCPWTELLQPPLVTDVTGHANGAGTGPMLPGAVTGPVEAQPLRAPHPGTPPPAPRL